MPLQDSFITLILTYVLFGTCCFESSREKIFHSSFSFLIIIFSLAPFL